MSYCKIFLNIHTLELKDPVTADNKVNLKENRFKVGLVNWKSLSITLANRFLSHFPDLFY